MIKKKDSSIKHIILRITLAAEIVAFIIVALLFGGLIWVFVSTDEESFEEKYEAAQKKYEKYLNGPVSGQEVLDLIDNWDEADFGLAVDSVKNGRVRVDNVDKNDPNAVFTYWKKESGWYIDPNAYYKANFIIYQNPRKESDRGIIDLYFHLVEDPSLADDNATENGD